MTCIKAFLLALASVIYLSGAVLALEYNQTTQRALMERMQ